MLRLVIFVSSLVLMVPAQAMEEGQLLALTSSVKEMCETPTKTGKKFKIEGGADGGVIFKALGAKLEGSISKETWEGIEQIRETQPDRLICVTTVLSTLAPLMSQAKPTLCRHRSHGVERYQRTFDVDKNSSWMGGGFDPVKWCNVVIGELRGQHPEGEFRVVKKSERSESKCSPFNCPQYMYFCTVNVKTDPLYIEKKSAACS